MMDKKIEQFANIIKESKSLVFFGGAGVSTASGIPDFRGTGGLKALKLPFEVILSSDYFWSETDNFFDFYKNHMVYRDAKPNTVHKFLAKLEKQNKIKAVITQNIDGLHQLAGSKNVIELHGSILRNHCAKCGESYDLDYVMSKEGVPHCKKCNGIIKPDVVLYGEMLNEDDLISADRYIKGADTLIIAGTSLAVQPAASLIYSFKGKNLILVNKQETPNDRMANLIFHEDMNYIFSELDKFF